MDFLFDKILNDNTIKDRLRTLFIIDSNLLFVSLTNPNDCNDGNYKLMFVESNKIGERLMSSDNESDFDMYVINKNKPLLSIESKYDNNIRIVTVLSYHGNPKVKKNKKTSNRNVIERRITSAAKLF